VARSNSIRIIGGNFRGRRLHFPDAPGLRPTADRLRETLFNWLQGRVEGSCCLDLFAGSGALGLEALSRGADEVQFVETSRAVACQLQKNLQRLDAEDRTEVKTVDGVKLLKSNSDRLFHIVFLDPPFVCDWLPEVCQLLETNGWLADQSWVYLEQDSQREWPILPENWQLYREAKAGQAACRLYRRAIIGG
jgi:16S rRNA (guanine966-N2)-methyltransferase